MTGLRLDCFVAYRLLAMTNLRLDCFVAGSSQ